MPTEFGKTDDEQLVIDFRRWMVSAEAAHKKWRETFKIDDLDKYWEGDQTPAWWNEEFFVPINLVFANIQRQLDNLTTVTPYYNVRPDRTYTPIPDLYPQYEAEAKVRESLLNATVKSRRLRREVRKVALDAYISMGVIKVYYQPYLRKNPKAGGFIPGSESREPEYRLFKENFVVSRRNIKDIRLDPFADSIENIKKVAERLEYTLEEVKSNKLFKNTETLKSIQVRPEEKVEDEQRKQGTNNLQPATGGNSSHAGFSLGRDREEMVTVWEVYDIENNRIQAFAEGHDLPLRDELMDDSIDEHSYVFLWYVDRRDTPYPVPGMFHQLGPQDEYNVTRNQTMLHRRRFNRKYTYRRGAVKDDALAKLENPHDGVAIPVEADGEVIRPIADAPLDQAVYFDTAQLRRDFQDVAGEAVGDSELAKIEKTGVANLLSESQQGRVRGARAVFQEFYESIAEKLMKLYEEELSLPMAVALTGVDGLYWTPISRRSFQAGQATFRYEVAADSLVPQTPETERASWIAFLQFMALNPNFGANPLLVEKSARAFGVYDKQIVQEVTRAAQAAIEQQMLMGGGSPGKPGISSNVGKQMGVPG